MVITIKNSVYEIHQTKGSTSELVKLKNEWLASLVSPQDGMWESFRTNATHWEIKYLDQMIGYISVNENNQLLQFYISPKHLSKGKAIFKTFIENEKIKGGIVGTNNPIYLSIAMNFVNEVEVNTYLFRERHETEIPEKSGTLRECQMEDVNRVVNFCNYATGAPKEWLTEYIGELIKEGEVYVLEKGTEIIGTCEIRKSKSAADFADIGMIVSPDYRRKGYGTYLLHEAANIAIKWKRQPICSCEKQNVGSLKAIHNCGFVSLYQLLSINFKQVPKLIVEKG